MPERGAMPERWSHAGKVIEYRREEAERRTSVLTLYHYPKCATSRKGKAWLDRHGLSYRIVDIVAETPDIETLRDLWQKSGLPLDRWFNPSSGLYRELGLKDRLPSMSDDEKLRLLAAHGKLIRRPVITDGKRVTIGFDEATMERVWLRGEGA